MLPGHRALSCALGAGGGGGGSKGTQGSAAQRAEGEKPQQEQPTAWPRLLTAHCLLLPPSRVTLHLGREVKVSAASDATLYSHCLWPRGCPPPRPQSRQLGHLQLTPVYMH